MSDIASSRTIREIILSILYAAAGAGPGLGFSFGQIRGGFSRARRGGFDDSDVRRELTSLVGDKLISRQWDDDLRDDYYSLTSAGMDFKRAGCPWEQIDRFTGTKI